MQALAAAQTMIHEKFQRDIIIDASVYGIGRGAGNLNIEIIAKYMNEQCGKQYDIEKILRIYENYIKDVYAIEPWGYSIPFYLTARYDCNPNYARYCIKNELSISLFENALKKLNAFDKIIYSPKILEDIRK